MSNTLPNPSDFTTVDDFLNWASDYFAKNEIFYGHGTDNPWDEAVMLVLHVLNLPAENDRSLLARNLKDVEQQKLFDLARKRVDLRKPVPYLTHEAWFAGERYYVNEDVLIPRSPLAEIIGNRFAPWLQVAPQRILDLCTGSGCLAICCAEEFPDAIVDAVDISTKALDVARKNIALHKCDRRVNPIESDLFTALLGQKYDIIISNPPYLAEVEMVDLPSEYKHEPVIALRSGADGLEVTRKILQQAKDYLTPAGLLIVEVGVGWQALEDLYPNVPFTWLEFANGGEGVFLLTMDTLQSLEL